MVGGERKFALTDSGMALVARIVGSDRKLRPARLDDIIDNFVREYKPRDVSGITFLSPKDVLRTADQEVVKNETGAILQGHLMPIEKGFEMPDGSNKSLNEYELQLSEQVGQAIEGFQGDLDKIKTSLETYRKIGVYLEGKLVEEVQTLPESIEGETITDKHRDFFEMIFDRLRIEEDLGDEIENQIDTIKYVLEEKQRRLLNLYEICGVESREDSSVRNQKIVSVARNRAVGDLMRKGNESEVGQGLMGLLTSEEGVFTKKRGEYKVDVNRLRLFKLGALRDAGFDTSPLMRDKSYIIGPGEGECIIFPRQFRESCLRDYVAHCESLADPEKKKEGRKIEFVKAVFEEKEDFAVGQYVGALYKDVRQRLVKDIGKIEEDATLGSVVQNDELRKKLEEIAFEELKTFVQSKKQKDCSRRNIQKMETFLRRYKPDIYEESFGWAGEKKEEFQHGFTYRLLAPLGKSAEKLTSSLLAFDTPIARATKNAVYGLAGIVYHTTSLPFRVHSLLTEKGVESKQGTKKCPWEGKEVDSYKVSITHNSEKLSEAAYATQSACIRGRSLSYFEEAIDDEGTIFLIGEKNGKVKGYARIFAMQDRDNGDPVLAIDTIEPPGKEFEKHKGLVNAFTLSAIQLGFDMNAGYVIGQDSRIGHGPRQAYSSVEKKVRLQKLGIPCPGTSYTLKTNDNGNYSGSPYTFIENWNEGKNG